MAEDEKIRVIAMYLESVKDGRRFLEVTKRVAKTKPVIIFKGGDTDVGAKTVASHTGSLAGERRIWDAFFKQAGVVRVRSMNEWVDAVMALSLLPAPGGNGVFLVGGGGGASVAAADACVRDGLRVPALSDATMERMREIVPAAGSIAGNPLDAWRVFEDIQYLMEALQLGIDDPRVDMIVVDRLIPRAAFHSSEDGDPNPALIDFIRRNARGKPVAITADSDGGDPDLAAKGAALRAQFCEAGIPAYASLARAARALVHLHRYHSRFDTPPRIA
jgi:acyl-CoA synthetase (NDP forming)